MRIAVVGAGAIGSAAAAILAAAGRDVVLIARGAKVARAPRSPADHI
ncbi:NAD-binding protein [Sphingobium sp. LMA1-1-1.1]